MVFLAFFPAGDRPDIDPLPARECLKPAQKQVSCVQILSLGLDQEKDTIRLDETF